MPVVVKIYFKSDGTANFTGLLNFGSGTVDYNVDATGGLYLDNNINNVNKIVCETNPRYIKTHHFKNGIIANVDLFFFDEVNALSAAGLLSNSISGCRY